MLLATMKNNKMAANIIIDFINLSLDLLSPSSASLSMDGTDLYCYLCLVMWIGAPMSCALIFITFDQLKNFII